MTMTKTTLTEAYDSEDYDSEDYDSEDYDSEDYDKDLSADHDDAEKMSIQRVSNWLKPI